MSHLSLSVNFLVFSLSFSSSFHNFHYIILTLLTLLSSPLLSLFSFLNTPCSFSSLVIFTIYVNFVYHCQLFLSLIFSLVFHSFFLTNARSFSLSISLISYVVVEMTFLTVILVNLIPLSLFFTVFNFSPLSLPLFLSPYFFTGLWAPQGTLFMWPHPSVSTKHATHAHTQTHKWKHS